MAQKFTVPITVKQLTSAGSDAITVYVDADTYARLKVEAGGRLVWGSGSGTGDVNLYRDGADVLRTDDTFKTPILFVDGIEIDTTGAQPDDVLKFNGTKFISASASFGGGGASLTVSDTAPATPSEGDLWFESDTAKTYVYYDSTWVEIGAGGGVLALNDIGDVNAPTPSTDDFLKWNGTEWVSASVSFASSLDGLTDVVITSPEEFQGLSYNGTNWVNSHIPLVSYVRNAETTTLTTGTCVYLFGSTGDHATVKRADNDSDSTSSKTIGIVAANILANENGPVVTRGYVDGVDLSVGYSAGDVLWLGEDGGFTTVKPTAPEHLVFIGVVVRATNNGIIYVATQNGYELDELHDVAINGKTSGDFLKYNGTLWVNDQINLGTDTVGNYVADVVAGTGITVTHTPGEGSSASVALNATLNDLSDVSTAGAVTGDVIKYNGSSWISASVEVGGANVTSGTTPPASPNVGDLWLDSANVDLYIYYDNHWVQLTGEEPLVEDINDLADVAAPNPVSGQFLKYDGTYWIPASIPTINALDDVGDVNVTGATSGQFLKWNGQQWVADSIVGGATTSSSAPSSPTTGQLWFDTDDARTYVYYDNYWVEVGASGQGATVSDTAPTNPISGQLWYKSNTGGFYIYYSGVWVEVGASPATFPTGKSIAMSIVFGG